MVCCLSLVGHRIVVHQIKQQQCSERRRGVADHALRLLSQPARRPGLALARRRGQAEGQPTRALHREGRLRKESGTAAEFLCRVQVR